MGGYSSSLRGGGEGFQALAHPSLGHWPSPVSGSRAEHESQLREPEIVMDSKQALEPFSYLRNRVQATRVSELAEGVGLSRRNGAT